MASNDDRAPNQGSSEDEVSLRDIWNLLLRNSASIVIVTMLIAGAVTTYTFLAVPTWESVASIRIDEEQTNLPVLDVLGTLSGGSEVETEMDIVEHDLFTSWNLGE